MFVTTTIAMVYWTVFVQGITIKPLVKFLNVKVQSENPFVIPQPVLRSTEGIEIPSVSYSLHVVDRNRSFHQIDSLPNVWI